MSFWIWQIKGIFVFGFSVFGSLLAHHLFRDETAVFAHARVRARLPWDFVLFAFTTFTRRVVESHQSKVKQPCSLMCVEELFCPLATLFWRVLLKYVRKCCVTSWYIVGYIGSLWRSWKQKVKNCCNVRVRVRARTPVLTSSSSQFSAFLTCPPFCPNFFPWMRVLLVVTIALLLNISLHRCNRFSPNYAEKCPTFTQKNSDVLPRISEISPKMSENFFEFSDCLGAQSPKSPSLALFSPRLFCLSPSPPYALLLPNYDPNWGIMGKFPNFWAIQGRSRPLLQCKLSYQSNHHSPIYHIWRGVVQSLFFCVSWKSHYSCFLKRNNQRFWQMWRLIWAFMRKWVGIYHEKCYICKAFLL